LRVPKNNVINQAETIPSDMTPAEIHETYRDTGSEFPGKAKAGYGNLGSLLGEELQGAALS
jgi:hypothetical protein